MPRHAAGIRTGRHISVKARGGGVQCLRSALPWQLITFIPSRGIGTPITGVLIAFERYPSREGGREGWGRANTLITRRASLRANY